jgi:4-hydroxybenzoate polyprenyltransferase
MIKQIRPVNLLIMAATMYAMRWLIIKPLLFSVSSSTEVEVVNILTEWQFALLVVSVVLIGAGGYIINDLNDRVEDAINKAIQIKSQAGNGVYFGLTGTGLALAAFVGWQVASFQLALIHVAVAISLWFYANYFKGSVLIGNFIISFCTAMVPLVVGVYEVVPLQFSYPELAEQYKNFSFNFVAYWIIGFSLMAFLFTLIREGMKDVEDVVGDRAANKKTLPVQYGVKMAKYWVLLVIFGTIGTIWHIYYHYLSDKFTMIFGAILTLGLLYQMYAVWKAETVKQWHTQSTISKLLGAFGLFYAVGVAYMIHNGILL